MMTTPPLPASTLREDAVGGPATTTAAAASSSSTAAERLHPLLLLRRRPRRRRRSPPATFRATTTTAVVVVALLSLLLSSSYIVTRVAHAEETSSSSPLDVVAGAEEEEVDIASSTTSKSSVVCVDTTDWTDAYGDDCAFYAAGPNRCRFWGGSGAGTMGVANDNCCACGKGGTTNITTATAATATATATTAATTSASDPSSVVVDSGGGGGTCGNGGGDRGDGICADGTCCSKVRRGCVSRRTHPTPFIHRPHFLQTDGNMHRLLLAYPPHRTISLHLFVVVPDTVRMVRRDAGSLRRHDPAAHDDQRAIIGIRRPPAPDDDRRRRTATTRWWIDDDGFPHLRSHGGGPDARSHEILRTEGSGGARDRGSELLPRDRVQSRRVYPDSLRKYRQRLPRRTHVLRGHIVHGTDVPPHVLPHVRPLDFGDADGGSDVGSADVGGPA